MVKSYTLSAIAMQRERRSQGKKSNGESARVQDVDSGGEGFEEGDGSSG